MKGFVFRYLIFSFAIFGIWGCELETFEEIGSEEISEQVQDIFQVQSVNKNLLNSLGKKVGKRTGFNVIESAQQRAFSDFTFDLDASLLTTDTLKRRTYTVPFLEKDDRYSTFNLVMVADSTDNVLDQYVLQYEFDSIQHQTFQETENLLSSGVTIKRFPFSSFFNDSNPGFLERCQGISDGNGDPVVCDQITINPGSGTGGGGSGSGSGGSVTISPGSGGGGSSCSASVSYIRIVNCPAYDHPGNACTSPDSYAWVITISCNVANQRKAPSNSMMECMNCDIDDFGSPAFTPTKTSNAIDRDLGGILSDYHLQYLSNNPTFANNLRAAILADSEIDESAALFTIAAGMNDVLDKPFTSLFGIAVDDLVEADLSNPIILHYWSTYFSAKIAFLKHENPNKYKKADGSLNTALLYFDAYKDAAHWGLDIIGLVPVLGEPADLVNGVFYAIEGDGVNATLSVASSIPLLGWVTSGAKMGMKVVGSASDLSSRKILRWFVDKDQIVRFGDASQLRKVLGITSSTKQAHHIVAWADIIQKNPVVQKAAKSREAFHLNETLNGIPVDSWRNQPNHDLYNNRIKGLLDNFNQSNPKASPEEAYDFLTSLISRIKTEIVNNPDKHLNDILFR